MKYLPAKVALEEDQIKEAIREFVKARGYKGVGQVELRTTSDGYKGPDVHSATVEVFPEPERPTG